MEYLVPLALGVIGFMFALDPPQLTTDDETQLVVGTVVEL
jgi:hypothetical protein